MRQRIYGSIRGLVCALLICAFLGGACALTVSAADSSNPIPKASQGVVQVEAYFTEHYETGSGFAVGIEGKETDIYVTNWHVVADDYGNISDEVFILDRRSESISADDYIPCEVLYTTNGYPDLAILRAKEKISGIHALPLLRSEAAPAGTRVYALGYPAFTDKISTTASGADSFTVTSGVVSRFIVMDDWEYTGHTENRKVILHDALIDPGNSGGPLITEDGMVIGINTYSFTNPDTNGTYWAAVYIDYAVDALKGLGVPFTYYSEVGVQEVIEGDSPVRTELLIGGAVLAAVLLCLFFILKSRSSKPSPRGRAYKTGTETSTEYDAFGEESESSSGSGRRSRSRRGGRGSRSQRDTRDEDAFGMDSEYNFGTELDMESTPKRSSRRKKRGWF